MFSTLAMFCQNQPLPEMLNHIDNLTKSILAKNSRVGNTEVGGDGEIGVLI